MNERLKQWIEWLKSKGLSRITIKNYFFYYKKFNFGALDQEYIIKFLNRYNNTVARAFIKSILQFLKVSNIEVPKITGRKKIRYPEIVTREEVHLISKAMRTERNKIMALLNFYAGLRLSELVNIKPYDFKWKDWNEDQIGKIKIIGKGNKQRPVFIPGVLMKRIHNWIRNEVSQRQSKEDPLFRIKGRRYEILLSNASKKAIDRRVNPHLMRHSVASYLHQKGLDLKEIGNFLGHKSIITTQIYLHINKEELAKKIKKAFE